MRDVPPQIHETGGPVVFFPVRHHSPAAARMVASLIREMRPALVLIEGPSDYNPQIDELALPHQLPIAIYSWVRLPGGRRAGAFYPFCIYSPEWQALSTAREVGAEARFIDLPYAFLADEDERVNRYADGRLARSRYVRGVCARLGVEEFDDLWDAMFELDTSLTPETYMRRAHTLCGHVRLLEGDASVLDERREAYMARQVDECAGSGKVLVVTGGYHSLGLWRRLAERNFEAPAGTPPPEERGIALTPYSYERLDSLTGYDAGLPNPGYYDTVWRDREAGRGQSHRRLLVAIVRALRDRKQRVSSADLIAAETGAQALARLRGHEEVWRTDLVDGIIGAWLKDDVTRGRHPMLEAVHEVLRGDARGVLAEGTSLPALMRELQEALGEADLVPRTVPRNVEFELPADRDRAVLLHRIRILEIAGFRRVDGTDFSNRDDLSRLFETWELKWSPNFDATAVESARYGATLVEASAHRLLESAQAVERDAGKAAALLVDASLAALHEAGEGLHAQVVRLIRFDASFVQVTAALDHLLYLYHFDEVLGTRGRADLGALLREAFARALWLLETLGQLTDADGRVVRGVRGLVEVCERCGDVDRGELVEVLRRVRDDDGQDPAVRGAATGALWVLGDADEEQVRRVLARFADPDCLGDFLHGLFTLARELFQREPRLLLAVDSVLTGYADEQFLQALPSLRLAFTSFTPREKEHVAMTLLEAYGESPLDEALAQFSVVDGVRMFEFESRLFETARRYGVRT